MRIGYSALGACLFEGTMFGGGGPKNKTHLYLVGPPWQLFVVSASSKKHSFYFQLRNTQNAK